VRRERLGGKGNAQDLVGTAARGRVRRYGSHLFALVLADTRVHELLPCSDLYVLTVLIITAVGVQQ
jgi:hypothetical protein